MIDIRVPELKQAGSNYPPPIGQGTHETLRKWVDSGLYYGHDIYCRDYSEMRRAELYDQGMQWLRQGLGGFEGGSSLAQWVEVYWRDGDPSYIPTPVFNEGHGARVNESARLGRPNYRPKCTPRAERPDLKSREGARLMQEQIRHRLRESHWDDKHGPLLYYHMPLYGGAWWKSEWVLRWDELVSVPVLQGAQCPNKDCGLRLADRNVPQHLMGKLGETAGNASIVNPDGSSRVDHCPRCADHPEMVPLQPTLEEAAKSHDSAGRPLGTQQPRGDWEMTIRSPYDVFPRNFGLDTLPGDVKELVEAHVQHLDWVGLRWPDKVGHVRAENPAILARYHPVAGAPDLLYSLLDHRMFENCVRVKERHKLPWMEPVQDEVTGQWVMKLNRGRSVIIVGDVVMFDGSYLMDSVTYPGETVERVVYDYVPWELKDGGRRLKGQSLWTNMFDPQDACNEIRSQTQAVRKRLAVPIYVVLTTHQFTIQGMRGGLPGALAEIEPDPNAPTVLPQLINNETIDEGVRYELQDAIDAVGRYAGYTDVEQGNPPTNVSAGNALTILKGEAGERREPRLARIKASLSRAWSHGARLMAHMYLEARPVKFKDEDGEELWRYMKGLDFNKQMDIGVDAEPDVDAVAQEIEVVRDMLQLRVIDPANMTPQQLRQLARKLRAPEDLFEDDDIQDKDAQREWIEYKDEKRMPRIDFGMDDDSTHYKVHGRQCHQAYFREKEREADWDGALAILNGTWHNDLTALSHMGVITPLIPPYPPDLQDRIAFHWTQTLQMQGWTPPPGGEESFDFVVYWRAHTEAHRLSDEIKQVRAAQMPQLAAPGAEATEAGNQPTAGAPPAASDVPNTGSMAAIPAGAAPAPAGVM